MDKQLFFRAAGLVFFLAAALHLVRVLQGWDLTLGGTVIPPALSIIAVLITGYLSIQAFRLQSKK